ncbi:hypothetical protein BJ878DRAFT_238890 [Calycina marina]|uniref:Protein transport protein sec73 n=1 Tax=Calycina marina TaxID=1763456 RepID=A0A9P8CH72_9HELO|nr:hypothetical protein BJ878DRAFT_238890 [Calycina marina]
MPTIQALLRRKGQGSDMDMRRHSFYSGPSTSNASNPIVSVVGRASEQIPRRPFAAEFPSPESAAGPARSTTSIAEETNGEPVTQNISPPVQEETPKHRRFSMLKFRHASDSQLSTRARREAHNDNQPPIPTPAIITTAPTMDMSNAHATKKKSKAKLISRGKSSVEIPQEQPTKLTKDDKKERRKSMSESRPSGSKARVTFDEPDRPAIHGSMPPAYGDEASSTLALPINRLSESSRSDGSSGDHGIYASTTTTTHTVHTTTTFFRLPRRKEKKKGSGLFSELSHLPQKSALPQHSQETLSAPRSSVNNFIRGLGSDSLAVRALRSPSTDEVGGHGFASPFSSPSALVRSTASLAGPGVPLMRHGSIASNASSPSRATLGMRGRSSTLSSLRNIGSDDPLPTPPLPSTRTSTSTGRKSFGDLFGLSARLRQNSEPAFPKGSGPGTPASSTSKNNSMQLVRDPVVVLPERFDDDTPAKYLVRLEEAVSRGVVASVLCKGTDAFSQAVLRSYMRGFSFFEYPMDMAIRKLLMEVELPKETQQIDRCLQSFANRYDECNPGIYASPEQAYFIAFSLLILHTDVFNKNNKNKMQKPDYLKNTRGEGIFDEILECFYDNISYTPFIHVEDDLDINGERIVQYKAKKKSLFPRGSADPLKRPSKEPVDPYTLIIDGKLDTLRPNLKDVMYLEEHYSYLGTAPSLNLKNLQKTFFRTGILQIISARSRPDAFMSEKTVINPEEALPGVVDIKITKVGLLWRKDIKKKKTRSPWQEWGAILTGAQLYFFRNTTWIKNLMAQHEAHIKQGHDGSPVIFKPPLDQFKPDALMSTDDAVALLDSTYKKHKNAFLFVRHGGFEETFLADNEDEMNDWLAKLNYAAAFRTSGVRMRGVVGGNYDGQRTRGIRRLDSHNDSTKSIQTPTGEVTIVSGRIDTKMAQDILNARREIMLQKIAEGEEKLAAAEKQLEGTLRNARHLQTLAPVLPKTRDQVLLAAGRMAAQLKWSRMEIWRMKCHRDILLMDLEEEKGSVSPIPRLASEAGSTSASPNVNRLNSKPSTVAAQQRNALSPAMSSVTRTSTQAGSEAGTDFGTDDVFQTPPLTSSSSFSRAQASWELPALNFDARGGRKTSFSSGKPSSPKLATTPSRKNSKPITSEDSPQQTSSPRIDAAEQTVLEQSGFVESDSIPDVKRPGSGSDVDESKDQLGDKEKSDKGKIRRSLHRTLREAHVVPTHRSSRKGKDSSSGAATAESPDDVLARGTGSFVVHGKKASVITFGAEFSSLTPDERLRLRKQPQKSEAGLSSPATIDDDFHSILAEPFEYHERRNSTEDLKEGRSLQSTTSSSNTIMTPEAIEEPGTLEAIRTPLSPVIDSDEVTDYNNNVVASSTFEQTAFYTPLTPNSPTSIQSQDQRSERNILDESEAASSKVSSIPTTTVLA